MTDPHTTCDTLQTQLSDKLDSGTALNVAERQHLGECPCCAEFHRFITGSVFSSIAIAPAGANNELDLTNSIMARLDSATKNKEDQAGAKQSNWKKIIGFTTLAAAAAVAISTSINSENNSIATTPPAKAISAEHEAAVERFTSLPAEFISPESLEQGFSNISQATAKKWTFVSNRISNIKSDIEEKANHLSDKFLHTETSLPQSSLPMQNSSLG